MAYTLPEKLGTIDLHHLTVYKWSGTLHLFVEGGLLHRSKWALRYIVICKRPMSKYDWTFCCFLDSFAEKSEKNYLMTEFESVKEYDVAKENVTGFTIKFEDPTRAPLIFRCDTEETREIWKGHIEEAIIEARRDSGYSSDSNRQSKKYDTIGNVDNQFPANPSVQKKAELPAAKTCKVTDVELSSKHHYEYMVAENSSFKRFGKRKSLEDGERIAPESNPRRHEQTEGEQICLPPVQETKRHLNNDPSSGTVKERMAKKGTVMEIEHTYANVDNRHNTTVTNTSEHRSTEIFSSSLVQSSSQSKDNDQTNVKLLFAPSELTSVKGDESSNGQESAKSYSESARSSETESYVSIRDDETSSSRTTGRYRSESLASVRSGTSHSKTSNSVTKNARSTTGCFVSFSSNKGAASCSSQTSVNTLAFSKTQSAHSSTSPATTHPYIPDKENHSSSEETVSFVSVNTHETCLSVFESASVQANSNGTGIQMSRNAATETNSPHESLSSSAPIGAYDSLDKHEASLEGPSGDDETAIYENTDTFSTAYVNNRKGSESSRSSNICNIHSSNSSSSVGSSGSDSSCPVCESTDENAHYVNITYFQSKDYFCEEKKNAKRNLKNKPNGTFLVCQGESGQELYMVTPVGVRYFLIHEQDSRFSLLKDFTNTSVVFLHLDHLLSSYRINDLPSQEYSVKLVKGYNTQQQEGD